MAEMELYRDIPHSPTQAQRPEQIASPRPHTIEDAYLLLPYTLHSHFTHGGLFG
jgi:hypothetical protein